MIQLAPELRRNRESADRVSEGLLLETGNPLSLELFSIERVGSSAMAQEDRFSESR